MAKLKKSEPISQRVRISSRELLIFTNRGTAGKDYTALAEALDRLAGTRISTNVRTGDEEQFDTFGLIDAASIRRKQGLDGRLLWCEVKLSDWVFNAIRSQEILTLHRDYFRLRKPIERRVYEIARKHCGQQDQWKVGLLTLLSKTGSQSPEKRFRQMIRHLVAHDHLPDYSVTFDTEADMVTFATGVPWRRRCPPLLGRVVLILKPTTTRASRAELGCVLPRTRMAQVAGRERDRAEDAGLPFGEVLPELVLDTRPGLNPQTHIWGIADLRRSRPRFRVRRSALDEVSGSLADHFAPGRTASGLEADMNALGEIEAQALAALNRRRGGSRRRSVVPYAALLVGVDFVSRGLSRLGCCCEGLLGHGSEAQGLGVRSHGRRGLRDSIQKWSCPRSCFPQRRHVARSRL